MSGAETRQLAVTDNEFSRRLIGIVSLSDLTRTQAHVVARNRSEAEIGLDEP